MKVAKRYERKPNGAKATQRKREGYAMHKVQAGWLRPEATKFMTGPKPGEGNEKRGARNRVMQLSRASLLSNYNSGSTASAWRGIWQLPMEDRQPAT
jgi:hypothetical protein